MSCPARSLPPSSVPSSSIVALVTPMPDAVIPFSKLVLPMKVRFPLNVGFPPNVPVREVALKLPPTFTFPLNVVPFITEGSMFAVIEQNAAEALDPVQFARTEFAAMLEPKSAATTLRKEGAPFDPLGANNPVFAS